MTKSPLPLVDISLLGPVLALANVYWGQIVPELYLLTAVVVRGVGGRVGGSYSILLGPVLALANVYWGQIVYLLTAVVVRGVGGRVGGSYSIL